MLSSRQQQFTGQGHVVGCPLAQAYDEREPMRGGTEPNRGSQPAGRPSEALHRARSPESATNRGHKTRCDDLCPNVSHAGGKTVRKPMRTPGRSMIGPSSRY